MCATAQPNSFVGQNLLAPWHWPWHSTLRRQAGQPRSRFRMRQERRVLIMLMNRLSPLHLLDEMERTFAPFAEAFQRNRPLLSPETFPAVNAWSDAEHFYLEAEIPGLEMDNLEIFVTDG